MSAKFDPQELADLAASLSRVPETESTAQFLLAEAGRFYHQWKSDRLLRADEIPIPLPRKKALFPANCELEASFLSFRFRPGDQEHLPSQADYQVRVEGWLITSSAVYELQDHWRVDTHIEGIALEDGRGVPHEPHPFFHFQRGGHAQDAFANGATFIPSAGAAINGDWRGLFQCPGPRMPALPMDPILAIDFCIGQGDGKVWGRLRNIPEYFDLIERAQKRLWQPFFKALREPAFQRLWLGTFVI
ncbi:hypothetical protein [Inquilinus sp. OTU3971]|uniref:hypothetical protein n=1 Tax=Inquilinus sp. OTU3971 TaxID=3043855 RepID=UPI00313CCFCD